MGKEPSVELKTHYAFSCTTSFLDSTPPLVSLQQINVYREHIFQYGKENDCEIPNELVFCAVPEKEFTEDIYSFIYANIYTFVVLENVSFRTKSRFENYEPKIEYDY